MAGCASYPDVVDMENEWENYVEVESADDSAELKSAYDHAMLTIDQLMAEKDEIEQKLLTRIEDQDQRIEDLEEMVKQLLASRAD